MEGGAGNLPLNVGKLERRPPLKGAVIFFMLISIAGLSIFRFFQIIFRGR